MNNTVIDHGVATAIVVKVLDDFSISGSTAGSNLTASTLLDDAVSKAKRIIIRRELSNGSIYRQISAKYGFSPELIASVSCENTDPFN